MNKGRESLDVSPQAGDQSNREPLKKYAIDPPNLKIKLFLKVFFISLSLQIYHSIILGVLFCFRGT